MFQGYGWITVPIIGIPLLCGIGLSHDAGLGLPARLVGAWVGPIILFFVGRALNRSRVVGCRADGTPIVHKPFHAAYMIPLQYTAPVWGGISSLLVIFSPHWR